MRRRRRSRLEQALARRRAATRAERERDRSRRRAVAFFVLFLTGAATLLFLTVRPRPAHGAARVPITWTAPAGARSYEARARRPDGVYLAVTLSADTAGAAALIPAAAGAREVGWVLVSTDWRAGGWMLWVRACNSAGCAPWSNAMVTLAGIPDTLWHLERLGSAGIAPPVEGSTFRRAVGRVGWALMPGDTLTPATIEHQEITQLRERARLCELFGFWALRGAAQSCP